MTWRELEQVAPEIARLGRAQLERSRVALLGTVRKDGSPRISPVEPQLCEENLLFGAMAWSLKTSDLLRDPRCALHSAVSDPDSGEGELKLYGRAIKADERTRASCPRGWWVERPPGAATVFMMHIEQAAFVSWDTKRGEMTARLWSPGRGYRETRRDYP
jgi:hypothetical protein